MEPWSGVVTFRNRLAHTPCWLVDTGILRQATQERLPKLLATARELVPDVTE